MNILRYFCPLNTAASIFYAIPIGFFCSQPLVEVSFHSLYIPSYSCICYSLISILTHGFTSSSRLRLIEINKKKLFMEHLDDFLVKN